MSKNEKMKLHRPKRKIRQTFYKKIKNRGLFYYKIYSIYSNHILHLLSFQTPIINNYLYISFLFSFYSLEHIFLVVHKHP